MNEYEIAFIEYCQALYGGTYKVKNDTLFISIEKDLFKINLTDRKRFGKFAIYHQNQIVNLDGSKKFHKQLDAYVLDFALFACFTHYFNKEIKILNQKEDLPRFKQDVIKYLNWKKEQKEMEII